MSILTMFCNCGGTVRLDDGDFSTGELLLHVGTGKPEADMHESERAAAVDRRTAGGRCHGCGAWLSLVPYAETVWRVKVG